MFQAVYGQIGHRRHSCLVGVLFLVFALECRGSLVRLDTKRLHANTNDWCLGKSYNLAAIRTCYGWYGWEDVDINLQYNTHHPGPIRRAADDLCLTFAQGIPNEPRVGTWAPCTGDSNQQFAITDTHGQCHIYHDIPSCHDTRRKSITMAGDETLDIIMVFSEKKRSVPATSRTFSPSSHRQTKAWASRVHRRERRNR